MKKIISILAISLSVLTVNAQTPKDSLVERKIVSFMTTPIVTDLTIEEIQTGKSTNSNSPKYIVYPMDEYNQGAKPIKMKTISDFNRKKKDLEFKNFKYHHQIYKFIIADSSDRKSIKDAIVYLERKHFMGKEKNPKKSPFIYYTWKMEGSQVTLNVLSGSRDF
jgi:hypothetical protein